MYFPMLLIADHILNQDIGFIEQIAISNYSKSQIVIGVLKT